MASIKPHRKVNPRNCDACEGISKKVPAQWIITGTGGVDIYSCDYHAASLAGTYKIEWPS